jgi:hypothetical protein
MTRKQLWIVDMRHTWPVGPAPLFLRVNVTAPTAGKAETRVLREAKRVAKEARARKGQYVIDVMRSAGEVLCY